MEDLWKGKNDWITDVEKLTIWYQENIYNNKDLDNYRDILDKMINTIRTVILEKGIIERDNEILISYQKQLYLTIINKSKEFNYKITSDEIKSLEEPKFNAENEIEQIENLIKYVDKVLYHKYKEITQIKSYTNWYARFLSLCIINELYNNKNKNDEIDSSLDLTIDIYANLCIFQQRILGTIVPFEGFLLIKEISLPTVEGNFSTDSRS